MLTPGQMAMHAEIKGATYEPQTPDEHIRGISLLLPVQERGGFVFLVAYTKKETEDAEVLLQVLMEQTRRLADSFGKESNPQHRFEQFLGALNETLAQYVREGRWQIPIEHLHALVGIVSTTEMYLSGTGELGVLFLHKKPSQRYQIFNLFRGLQTEQSLPTWEKTFAIVLDGDLHSGDVFCVSDKDLQRAIPPDELNHILSSLPPVGAVQKIRQYFALKDSLLLTILKVADESVVQTTGFQSSATPQSSLSVEAFNSTEEQTDRLLGDQRPKLSHLVKKVLAYVQPTSNNRSRILKELDSQGSFRDLLRRSARFGLRITSFLLRQGKKTVSKWFQLLKNKEGRTRVKTHLELKQRPFQGGFTSLFGRIRTAPASTKYLVGGVVVAAVVLVVGISTLSKSQARAAEEETYQRQLASIQDLMERAAGAVIYKDENQARSLYVNAQTLIESLPSNTPEREEHVQELKHDLQTALNEIRHLVTIPNPPLLADLETLTDGVFGNALILASGNLLVAGSDGRVYQYHRQEKRFDTIATATNTNSPIAMSQEDGRTYLLSSDGNISSVSFEDQTLNTLSTQDNRWIDLVAYANRLYLLRPSTETTEGQIVRFNISGSTLDGETDWITSRTVALDTAVSFTIDGNVYILMQDGSVSRFANGSEEGWNTSMVDPRLTQARKIWTNAESAYLYILEPSTQRIVVFLKETGAFVVQYRSDAFQGLTDFVVDESGYTIYVLAGSKLYSIAPSHLE